MIASEKGQTEDLSTLSKLDEHILLEELHERYKKDIIYTYVGDILIAVNPFKDVGIYGEAESKRYTMAKKSANPPHIFAVADMAFQSMLGHGGLKPADQCVLISGESGAGKTESTKLIIKQLVELCHGNSQLEQQILQVNPLLEAFGNAQTQLNDNSSRFGKYIQLRFVDGHVNGAKISEYLLEKSRVVGQHEDEQNFHIFYYLIAGQTKEISDRLNLKKNNDYRYLTNGNDILLSDHNNLQNHFKGLVDALDLVGFTDEEQQSLFDMVASVLHLGNVMFQTDEDDVTTVSVPSDSLRSTAKLLQVDEIEFGESLTSVVTVAKGEYFKINYSKEKSEDCRDAVSKAIYGRVFGWIVNKINQLLASPEQTKLSHQVGEIGILDIFGFEHFEKNSFEQACINLANEQLQFFFNQHIFKMEQEEYIREGIDWTEVPFVDNKPLLDLFLEKPIGILALLDEESLFPKATDQTFVQKLNQNFNKNSYYKKSRQSSHPIFTINHYAGQVTYDATQWLEKNRDTVPIGIMNLLKQSKNPLVKTLFKADISRTGTLALQGRRSTKSRKSRSRKTAPNIRAEGKKKMTVGGQFKNSLNLLMEKMTKSTPIFVRCLKPNHEKRSGEFDKSYINAQLLYTGMLETTKIRREGFAVRPPFQEFVDRYKVLIHKYKMKGTAANCVDILRSTGMKGWHVGKTKVFLKHWHIEQMADALEEFNIAATQLQKLARGFLARKEYNRLRQEASRKAQEEALRVQQEIDAKARQGKSKDQKNTSVGIQSGGDTEMFTQGTQVEESDSSESDGVLQDVFCKMKKNGKYGEPGTREATKGWFADTQVNHVISESGVFSEWFHGIITRREAEKLLEDKPIGCFLIRVSESRFGYSLSFRVEDRCRHYMIDQLANGKFLIIGESKVHKTLFDLVKYYQTENISNYSGYLTEPCGQQNGECNYIDLVSDSVYYVLEESAKTYGYHVPPAKNDKDIPPAIPPRNKGIYKLAQSTEVSRNRLLQNQKKQHT